ncbi:hypothetical protein H9657_10110 [Cellulomonas sp. Sa3CUA2]|uniref:ATP-binding protein n=1 Tax=Cellulomonas avistercoris TaxID=2762242 RepID=A0ABR8QDY2_9CELL|nr:hypothetical protein [Cellulomonas avistercoris]MBD7918626.1 hypothetical protein [Cellulomonas avistercoris]
MLAGGIDADVLVPEGFEDVSCEGASAWQVQVKSRQDRRNDFTAAEAAQHVLAVAASDEQRRALGMTGRPVLVLEKSIDGCSPATWGQVIGDLPSGNPLLTALEHLGAARGMEATAIRAVAERISVFVLPWQEAREQAAALLADRYALPRGVTGPIVLALRDAVARCIDTNAESNWVRRAGMDRTQIERVTGGAATGIDRTAVEQALTDGLCEPVDFDTPLRDDRFYEGVAAQPGHVAAGLPVPRPDLVEQIASAVDHGAPVLITGPSGVGKSVLLWMSASSMRDILWFRVRILREADVASLVALARAYGPTERARVGFLVDGVGLRGSDAWDLLVREVAPIAGIALLGTARFEDLQPLRSLAECVLIEPRLDENTAEQIYLALTAVGATGAAHWREAYREAHGLTLEYTHRLTSGRRLADVLGEQVRRRIDDPERGVEVSVIGLVAAAQRWGADLDLRAVQRSLDAPDALFRQSLGRLKDEHLVQEFDGRLSGLHQLRSSALSDAVWRYPPPTVQDSVGTLLELVDDEQLTTLVMSIMTEHPRLDDVVTSRLKTELRNRDSLAAWASALHGLRMVDFRRRCDRIVAKLDRLGVNPVDRAIAIQLAMLDSEPSPLFKSEVRKAIQQIEPDLNAGSPLRDAMASTGIDFLVSAVCGGSLEAARQLLAVLQGTTADLDAALVGHLGGSPLEAALRGAGCEDLGSILATARLVSQALAVHLFEAAGGQAAVIERLKVEYPELVEVGVVERDGVAVAVARCLHVSDEYAGGADAVVRAFAKVLLRCSPICDSVDVEARLPGDIPLQSGGYVMAVSHLQRRYDRPATEVAWNRLRINVAAAAGGLVDATARVADARRIVTGAHGYLIDLVRVWCNGELLPRDRQRLIRAGDALTAASGDLRVPVSVSLATLDSVEGVDASPRSDPVHGLAWALVENLAGRLFESKPNWAALAGFVGDQLRREVSEIRQEQWELLGEDPPAELEAMDTIFSCLNTVLLELAAGSLSRAAIRAIASSGPRGTSIYRVAEAARVQATRAEDEWAAHLVALAAGSGLVVEVHRRPRSTPSSLGRFASQFALGVEMDDLTQWTAALELLRSAIESSTPPAADRGTVLLFPVSGGRPIRMLAMAMVISIFPGTELFEEWVESLPEPWPTPLADALVEAHQALQMVSALGVLDARRGTSGVDQTKVDEQISRFRGALEAIGRLQPQDGVVVGIREELDSLTDRVQGEFDDDAPEEATLAARIAQGAMQSSNDEVTNLGVLMILALTWDRDPEAARQLLRSWELAAAAADNTLASSSARGTVSGAEPSAKASP